MEVYKSIEIPTLIFYSGISVFLMYLFNSNSWAKRLYLQQKISTDVNSRQKNFTWEKVNSHTFVQNTASIRKKCGKMNIHNFDFHTIRSYMLKYNRLSYGLADSWWIDCRLDSLTHHIHKHGPKLSHVTKIYIGFLLRVKHKCWLKHLYSHTHTRIQFTFFYHNKIDNL